MRIVIWSLLLACTTMQALAQTSIEDFVKEGIQYHDKGEYDKALESYKKALKIDSKSPLVNYEMSMSYLAKEEYKKAIKYADKVLKQNKEHMLPAYITKGSALDLLGKTKASIKLFKKAIKKTEGHYLLYYNLALNYYKINELEEAEGNAVKAIEMNPNHGSSHLLLANVHNEKGNKVQTLLATNYFLLLEPSSARAVGAYQMLQENFSGNVSKDKDKPNTINITLALSDDSQFAAAEMMISMLEASKSLEENEGKTADEMFVENTDSFFTVMGELKEDKNKDIWWSFYTPFFYDIAQSEHLETYCKYISQVGNEDSEKWLDEHSEKLTAFGEWLKGN